MDSVYHLLPHSALFPPSFSMGFWISGCKKEMGLFFLTITYRHFSLVSLDKSIWGLVGFHFQFSSRAKFLYLISVSTMLTSLNRGSCLVACAEWTPSENKRERSVKKGWKCKPPRQVHAPTTCHLHTQARFLSDEALTTSLASQNSPCFSNITVRLNTICSSINPKFASWSPNP